MRAMQLTKPAAAESRPLTLNDVETPTPGPRQVRLRVRACGVCRTDLHIVEGELPMVAHPTRPGHEVIGIVDQLGDGCTRFKIGDRVGAAWLHRTCGRCKFCQRDLENLCAHATFTGYHHPGGFAEHTVIDEDFAYAIPDAFDDAHAAPLLCAGIIGYRALRLAGMDAGRKLGLYGFGASAHIAIQIARHRGCEVYVFSRTESHHRLAGELGAVWTGRADQPPKEKLDSAIIFAPAGRLVPLALRALDRGGVLALAGIYMTPTPPLEYQRDLYYERVLRSVTASTRSDGEELLAAAAEANVTTHVQTFGLDAANDALVAVKHGHIDGAAVLLC
jgi:propanol-preferring alcohol dehydrogenase